CTAAWNPGVAGLAMSPDACRPTSEKTDRARRGRRRFNIGGPPTCRATAVAVARYAAVRTIDARSRLSPNRHAKTVHRLRNPRRRVCPSFRREGPALDSVSRHVVYWATIAPRSGEARRKGL